MTDQEFFNSLFPKVSPGEMMLTLMDIIDEHHDEWIAECEKIDKQHLATLN